LIFGIIGPEVYSMDVGQMIRIEVSGGVDIVLRGHEFLRMSF